MTVRDETAQHYSKAVMARPACIVGVWGTLNYHLSPDAGPAPTKEQLTIVRDYILGLEEALTYANRPKLPQPPRVVTVYRTRDLWPSGRRY